jgi:hypothetical protein
LSRRTCPAQALAAAVPENPSASHSAAAQSYDRLARKSPNPTLSIIAVLPENAQKRPRKDDENTSVNHQILSLSRRRAVASAGRKFRVIIIISI